jgi:lipopolysaccharide transport system permease protein
VTVQTPHAPGPVVRIRPPQGWSIPDLREVWEHRELAYFIVWRDLKVRYKQTVLGVLWAVIQPLLTMLIFTVVFGRLAELPSEGVPYPVFTFAALLPWQLFASGVTATANSMVGSASIVTKVYFPRLVIPIASTLVPLADFAISSVVLACLMVWFGVEPSVAILTLPLFVLLAVTTAFAAGLWLSALNVRYRDVQHAMPFLLQIWLFGSPVAYSLSLVPDNFWRTLYALNPMVAVIQGCRWAIVGGEAPWRLLPSSMLVLVVLLAGGLVFFRKVEDSFADVV